MPFTTAVAEMAMQAAKICPTGSATMRFRRMIEPRATPQAISTRQSEKELTMKFIKNFLCEEDGVTAIEYGLIASLVGVAIVVSVTSLGAKLGDVFTNVVAKLAPGA
jgi:pilus assembly protein Flp/PilA